MKSQGWGSSPEGRAICLKASMKGKGKWRFVGTQGLNFARRRP